MAYKHSYYFYFLFAILLIFDANVAKLLFQRLTFSGFLEWQEGTTMSIIVSDLHNLYNTQATTDTQITIYPGLFYLSGWIWSKAMEFFGFETTLPLLRFFYITLPLVGICITLWRLWIREYNSRMTSIISILMFFLVVLFHKWLDLARMEMFLLFCSVLLASLCLLDHKTLRHYIYIGCIIGIGTGFKQTVILLVGTTAVLAIFFDRKYWISLGIALSIAIGLVVFFLYLWGDGYWACSFSLPKSHSVSVKKIVKVLPHIACLLTLFWLVLQNKKQKYWQLAILITSILAICLISLIKDGGSRMNMDWILVYGMTIFIPIILYHSSNPIKLINQHIIGLIILIFITIQAKNIQTPKYSPNNQIYFQYQKLVTDVMDHYQTHVSTYPFFNIQHAKKLGKTSPFIFNEADGWVLIDLKKDDGNFLFKDYPEVIFGTSHIAYTQLCMKTYIVVAKIKGQTYARMNPSPAISFFSDVIIAKNEAIARNLADILKNPQYSSMIQVIY